MIAAAEGRFPASILYDDPAMDSHVQYARAKDGVNIACLALGEGLPVVQTPAVPYSQVQLLDQMPEDQRWQELMAGQLKLYRYDSRGTGLSDRDVDDFSLDAMVSDLEAVVDRMGLDRFAIWAFVTSGPVAITYAARHPERVSHLMLWSTWASSADITRLPQAQAFIALVDTDWDLFTQTSAHAFFGWSTGDVSRRAAAFIRQSISQEKAKAIIGALTEWDASPMLSQITAPTLIYQAKEAPIPDVSTARSLAAGIPNARLVLIDGPVGGWTLHEDVMDATWDFLGIQGPPSPAAERPGTVATVLFTDVVSSTALTQRVGDARAQELLRRHDAAVRDALGASGGTEIKHTGDGIMASFASASAAIECAIAIQRAIAAGDEGEDGLDVRVGLNAGEPIAEGSDLFGTAVQLARRICDEAGGDEILVSDVVRQLAAGKTFSFEDRGERALKGIAEPHRLFAVKWREDM
jgi:class 3 adenylate cyclase